MTHVSFSGGFSELAMTACELNTNVGLKKEELRGGGTF